MSTKHKRRQMAELFRSMATPSEADSQEAGKQEKQKAVKTSPRRGRGEKAPRTAAPTERRVGPLKQMTIKLEPDVRSRLLQESLRRKAEDSENWPIQRIVTEAVNAYLGGK